MNTEKKKVSYIIACISEFARKHNLSLKEAFQFLFHYKAIDFLKEHYDIEHTLSFDDVLEDMEIICQKNGGILI